MASKTTTPDTILDDPCDELPREDNHREPFDLSELSEVSGMRRLVARHHDRLRFCTNWGKWLVFDGRRWRRATVEHERHAQETVGSMRIQVERIGDPFNRAKVKSAFGKCETAAYMASILKLARSHQAIVISADQFDRQPMMINCLNGTVDLATGELRPHRPGDFLTGLVPVEYDATATCPTWERFLATVMDDDEAMISYLRRVAGYALTGNVEEHAAFWINGQGRNGKSLFINTLVRVVGEDYGMTAASHLLSAASSSEHPTALADLEGRRIVAVSEPPAGQIDENLVKALTGGEPVRARRMRQDNFEFQPSHKIFVTANHKPNIKGNDQGIWSRIRLLLFPVTIAVEDRDRELSRKLMIEAPGILRWMVQGALEWTEGGLREPISVIQATQDHQDGSDPVAEFIADRCVLEGSQRCKTHDLYRAYEDWAQERKLPIRDRLGSRDFSQAIEAAGYRKVKASSIYWTRIAPRPAHGQ